jgi:hypothetical protein
VNDIDNKKKKKRKKERIRSLYCQGGLKVNSRMHKYQQQKKRESKRKAATKRGEKDQIDFLINSRKIKIILTPQQMDD